jgi:hypothetical protein
LKSAEKTESDRPRFHQTTTKLKKIVFTGASLYIWSPCGKV